MTYNRKGYNKQREVVFGSQFKIQEPESEPAKGRNDPRFTRADSSIADALNKGNPVRSKSAMLLAQKPVSKMDDIGISETYKTALESQARKYGHLNKSIDINIASNEKAIDKLNVTPDQVNKRNVSKSINFKQKSNF